MLCGSNLHWLLTRIITYLHYESIPEITTKFHWVGVEIQNGIYYSPVGDDQRWQIFSHSITHGLHTSNSWVMKFLCLNHLSPVANHAIWHYNPFNNTGKIQLTDCLEINISACKWSSFNSKRPIHESWGRFLQI